jgi:hypothetical protein
MPRPLKRREACPVNRSESALNRSAGRFSLAEEAGMRE